jgi:hypothetical protein
LLLVLAMLALTASQYVQPATSKMRYANDIRSR